MASTLQNTITFLSDFGFFDVIVPFLLFFAIVFSILEKTKILGKDKTNVNLIVALAISLLTITANKVLNLVSSVIPNMILILVLFVMFVMIIGLFFKQTDEGLDFSKAHPNWFKFFMFLLFILTIVFILNAWGTKDGTALEWVLDSISDGGSSEEMIGGVILLLFVVGAIYLVARTPKKSKEE